MKIIIKKYSNGSTSYYSEKNKRHLNIPSELGLSIIDLQNEVRRLSAVCDCSEPMPRKGEHTGLSFCGDCGFNII